METALVLAASGLFDLCKPIPKGDKPKAQIKRAAEASGLPYSRVWNIWHGKARSILPDELKRIEDAKIKRTSHLGADLSAIAASLDDLAQRAEQVLALNGRTAGNELRALAARARHLASGA